ncbi:flagellar protein FlaG [Ureibacillus manganicus]|uniref:Flagellar protein FlaG n=1 Tax=Ureibacillus manganicus DSM 26584 TaxID=1384049 RepID=A0A0A3IAW4_9BACL|nr:flagellar protein FlaG [Ureibacillus manganicus]KGR80610.1 hypothetical protein CD29_01625 [Ureibacillus manganicus DSM 26584]
MRIDSHSHTIDKVASNNKLENVNQDYAVKQDRVEEHLPNFTENKQEQSSEKLQKAVDSVNEFFKINNSELKFIYHEGLEQYFVQLVNSETEEVVREIPPKKLLDVFYEMQRLAGMIIDKKI